MVGDDINSDVHAAQKCGMKGVLVKTGKFRYVSFKSFKLLSLKDLIFS